MTAANPRWHHFAQWQPLRDHVARALIDCANAAIAARGAFHIALAGGRTPLDIYTQLVDAATDWQAWSIYFGDERCAPRGDASRNDAQAQLHWLGRVPIPAAQIHAIPAELGAEQGAAQYRLTLDALAQFDLVLLGIGEDGHTASLFPGLPSGPGSAFAVYGAPKPPPERVSLSAARLSAARAVWFIASGADKRDALQRWRDGEAIPAASIAPQAGVDIFTDVAPREAIGHSAEN